MKIFYVNIYEDCKGQWLGDRFRSRRRAIKAATRVASKCVGRLKVRMKNIILSGDDVAKMQKKSMNNFNCAMKETRRLYNDMLNQLFL